MLHKEEEYISGVKKKKEKEKYFKLERELTVLEIRDAGVFNYLEYDC